MFIDEADITVQGGHGGAGVVSFGKKMGSGPDGGNGGKGGDVYFTAVGDITLLTQFTQQTLFETEYGRSGGRNRKSGKDGVDLEIKLPVGTTVIDKKTKEILFEMENIGQRELICKGGKGGHGNYEFRSSRRTTPKFSQPGLPGEKKDITLILKLIADFGLIGLPNAGKSSLLNELTNARVKIASYAFTTLTPNLGMFKGKVIADIPGLIEGASAGRGLGVSFLKHIEKVGVLLHCISSETGDPEADYKTIREELENYNEAPLADASGIFSARFVGAKSSEAKNSSHSSADLRPRFFAKADEELLKKPEIILITKSDLTDPKTIEKINKKLKNKAKKVLTVSIHDWESIEELKNVLSGS